MMASTSDMFQEMCSSDRLCPSVEICKYYRPPPLPPDTSDYYNPLRNFVMSNATLKASFDDYIDICSDFVVVPDLTPKTDETTSQAFTTTTQDADTHSSVESEETANAGLIAGLTILLVFMLVVVAFLLVWRWKKRKEKEQSYGFELDFSQALPIDEYRNVNYLHNKASQNTKKPWNGSSVQESKVENEYTNNHRDNEITPITDNGKLKTEATNVTDIGKGAKRVNTSITQGYVNNMFDDREQNGPDSPGIVSTKSDAPLIDNIDGQIVQTLPNETALPKIGQKTESENADKLKTYGSTNTVSQNRGSALEPIKSPNKSPERSSPRKKRKRSVRKSAPCPNANDLVEDMAENRKSV